VANAIAASTVTAKGDLIVANGASSVSNLAVGADGTTLVANSSQATGLQWQTLVPSQTGNSGKYLTTNGTAASWGSIAAGSLTLLSTTTLSGASTTISGISQNYTNLILISSATSTTADEFCIRLNGDTSNYSYGGAWYGGTTVSSDAASATNKFVLPKCNMGTSLPATTVINLPRYTTTSGQQIVNYSGFAQNNTYGCFGAGIMDNKSAGISSITILSRNGYTISGTSYLYGVN